MGGLALVVRTWLRPSARSLIGLVLLGGLENAVDDLGLGVGDTLDLVGVPVDW